MSKPHLEKEELLPLALILLTFVFGLVLEPHLPAELPTYWSGGGAVLALIKRDFLLYLMPGFTLALYLLLHRLPQTDPLKRNVHEAADAFFWLRTTVVTFLLFLHIYILGAAVNAWPANTNAILTLDFSYLFFMFGHYLPKLRRNYFYGVVTPWTLESNQTWQKTHTLAGSVYGWLAVVNLAGIFVAPWGFWLTVLLLIFAALVLTTYSRRVYKREFPHGAL